MRKFAVMTFALFVSVTAGASFDVGYDYGYLGGVDFNNPSYTENVFDSGLTYDTGVFGSSIGYDHYSFPNVPTYDDTFTNSPIEPVCK